MIWTTFGWAGITLSIPDSWEIAGISGDQKAGYLRLDDENMPRLELKWSESKRKKRSSCCAGRILQVGSEKLLQKRF